MAKRKIHESVTVDRIIRMVQADDHLGVCLACGEEANGVEPDARKYRCESCEENFVYGAEEVLMMIGG